MPRSNPNNLAIRNLAYRYAKALILRRPAAAYMTPKEITAAARNRCTPSLLALARINLTRKQSAVAMLTENIQ